MALGVLRRCADVLDDCSNDLPQYSRDELVCSLCCDCKFWMELESCLKSPLNDIAGKLSAERMVEASSSRNAHSDVSVHKSCSSRQARLTWTPTSAYDLRDELDVLISSNSVISRCWLIPRSAHF